MHTPPLCISPPLLRQSQNPPPTSPTHLLPTLPLPLPASTLPLPRLPTPQHLQMPRLLRQRSLRLPRQPRRISLLTTHTVSRRPAQQHKRAEKTNKQTGMRPTTMTDLCDFLLRDQVLLLGGDGALALFGAGG